MASSLFRSHVSPFSSASFLSNLFSTVYTYEKDTNERANERERKKEAKRKQPHNGGREIDFRDEQHTQVYA